MAKTTSHFLVYRAIMPLCHSGKGREEVLLIPHLTSAATEDKPFKCSLCEKAYKTMGWLTRHLGQAHGESEVPISNQ